MDVDVVFYAETGMPHVSVRILDDDGKSIDRGLGFAPTKTAPIGRGDPEHDTTKTTTPGYIRMVRFRLNKAVVDVADVATKEQFEHKAYILLVRDCVSFARVFAQKCGLNVPILGTTYWPHSFVKYLRDKNADRVVEYHDSRKK